MFGSQHILNTPVEYLKGVGPHRGELLRKELNLHTFQDLIHFYPYRYIDRSKIDKIKDIQEGEYVQLVGNVNFTEIVGNGRAKRFVANFRDDTGMIELVWFQGISWMERLVSIGFSFLVYGKVSRFGHVFSISHPEIDKLEYQSIDDFPAFQPVYSSNEKLRAKGLSGRNFVKIMQALWMQLRPNDIPEILPNELMQRNQLIGRYEALKNYHFPDSNHTIARCAHRLKFEELFIHQLGICKLKLNNSLIKGFTFGKVGDYFNLFYAQYLPFELTDDQKNVLREIRVDTQRGVQMNRLLQGDVGSGKTIVALLTMLLALDNDFQACLMAPTEILAQQHFLGIKELLNDMPIRVDFLSGTVKGKARKEVLKKLADGEIQILIGTHALIEDSVVFKNLGISIIDEQHRFGVAQRAKLWKKNILPPHVLVMTATPIPRTLAMTSYGDLEVSVIKNLPPGRKPISTIHRTEVYRAKIMDFIRSEVDAGRQAYIVYPLVKESEKLDYENLEAGYEQVKQYFHAHRYHICMVHGQMPSDEREQNMRAFVNGHAHIMVATTVIEVGVNVPNASVMLIESAERFGLSQLHQLRGRVGRGADKSYCILLTGNKLSETGRVRMKTMVEETSGFAIAEKDLELRGPGEIDGTKQSGAAELKIADIIRDADLMAHTREEALSLLVRDRDLVLADHHNLKMFLLGRKDKEMWSRIS